MSSDVLTSAASAANSLVNHISAFQTCVVAFSAGVDSSVVAKAAYLALKDNALAVTAVSPSLASGEVDEAKHIAAQIGIQHQLIQTTEVTNADYKRNDHDRCYFCKSELYSRLETIAKAFPNSQVLNGANSDDLGDYRPGLRAASEYNVRAPLVECGISKSRVREIARYWKLSCADKPAMPCLSSRIAYGVEVTPERLRMIDRAEAYLRGLDFRELRVRYHEGDLARVEVTAEEIPRLVKMRSKLVAELSEVGFRFVTIDLEGFQSGKLNQLIPLDVLRNP